MVRRGARRIEGLDDDANSEGPALSPRLQRRRACRSGRPYLLHCQAALLSRHYDATKATAQLAEPESSPPLTLPRVRSRARRVGGQRTARGRGDIRLTNYPE